MSNIQFHLDAQPDKKIEANLLYVTTSKYEGDWHSTLHTHYFTEFFYVIHGEGSFLVNDKNFPLKEDDLVIVNPNVEHTERSMNASPLEYIVVGIEGMAFDFGREDSGNSYSVFNYHERRRELLFYLRTMVAELENKAPHYEMVCQDLLEVLIIYLMRHTKWTMSIASARRTNKECGEAKRYIDRNYKEDITLEQLAELTHMNKYYLVHAFGKYTGMSPINYLIAKRVEEGKNLLASTNYSISQIADIIGFSSQSYFSQSFRKVAGETPGEYRRRMKNKPALPEQTEKTF